MFTGIIEEIGSIARVESSASSMRLIIHATKVLEDVKTGDSIAVNGVCLTVTSFTHDHFIVDVMPETFYATTLKNISRGSSINLERAMSANGRFGGHFVSGHIDGVGSINKILPKENAVYYEVKVPGECKHLFIVKGSVAIDGTSLTIFKVEDDLITVSLIPQTRKDTVLGTKHSGDSVNIECDMMAKYFYSFMNNNTGKGNQSNNITYSMLAKYGFMD